MVQAVDEWNLLKAETFARHGADDGSENGIRYGL
jgi:hypothetical protein